MNDTRDLFLRWCGIDVADVAVPHRLLRLRAEERNAQVVDQAASQLLARLRAATHQIPAPHPEWMTQQVTHARNFMVAQCVQTQPPLPPPVPGPVAAPPWQSPQPTSAEPPVVVRTTGVRRRSGFDAENVMGIVGILVMLTAAGFGAKLFHDEWWKKVMPRQAPKPQPVRPDPIPPTPSPPIVNPVGGGPRKRRVEPEPQPNVPDAKPTKTKGDLAAAELHLKSALANVGKGFFDEADLDAQKALVAAPACDEAQAVRLAVAYLREYSQLADEAMAALNGNNVVDLGPKHGKGAFIDRNVVDGSIKFQVNGRPKWFTIEELSAISGLRFRVTRDFLDNIDNPANDLILGAYHFMKRVDGEGNVDRKGEVEAARDAARRRWKKAAASGSEEIVEQAQLLQKLLQMERPD